MGQNLLHKINIHLEYQLYYILKGRTCDFTKKKIS